MTSDALIDSLSSGDAELAGRSAKTLARLGKPSLIPALLDVAIGSNFSAACQALIALSVFGENRQIADFLIGKLKSGDGGVRERAAFALKDLPQRRAFDSIKRHAANDSNQNARVWSLHALRKLAEPRPRLARGLRRIFAKATMSRAASVRLAGFQALFSLPGQSDEKLLRRALRDRDATISKATAPLWAADLALDPAITKRKSAVRSHN